jgi:hypothetical protein
LNWLAVAAGTLAAFAVGALWYSPALFAKPWTEAAGLDPDHMNTARLPILLAISVLLSFVTAIGLGLLLPARAGWFAGLMAGVAVAVAFVTPFTIQSALYEQKSAALLGINCGHQIVAMAVMGAVIGAF